MKRLAATIFIFLVGLVGLVGCQTTEALPIGLMPSDQVLSEREALLITWNPFSEKEIIPLWKAVAARVSYKSDGPNDVWQHPWDTYCWRTGDCEDMNLLLASALLAEGYDVCIVVGTTNPKESYDINHAWILLRLNGKSYYLDATLVTIPKTLNGCDEKRSGWLPHYTIRSTSQTLSLIAKVGPLHSKDRPIGDHLVECS